MSTSHASTPVVDRDPRSFWFLTIGMTLALLGALALGATIQKETSP